MHAIAMIQGRWWCPMCGSMGSWGWSMMLLWVVLLAAIVVVAFRLFQGAARRGPYEGPPPASPNAEEILRQRYARGEIDGDAYHRMLDDLRRGSPP